MENKYYVNVVTCEKISEDVSKITHPFDNLEVEKGIKIPFEIMLTYSYEVKTPAEVTFVIGVHYKDNYKPIAVMSRKVEVGTWSDTTKYFVKDFVPIGQGAYILEVRCGESINNDTIETDENGLNELLKKTKMLNKHIFTITYQ